tara:strand:- start:2651 stop:2827 length:177 start_codon:yes stop_codon:yes gene_type:complete
MTKDNLFQKQLDVLQRNYNKHGRYIEELEKDVAILKSNSHEPRDFVCCECCKHKIKEK